MNSPSSALISQFDFMLCTDWTVHLGRSLLIELGEFSMQFRHAALVIEVHVDVDAHAHIPTWGQAAILLLNLRSVDYFTESLHILVLAIWEVLIEPGVVRAHTKGFTLNALINAVNPSIGRG